MRYNTANVLCSKCTVCIGVYIVLLYYIHVKLKIIPEPQAYQLECTDNLREVDDLEVRSGDKEKVP